MPFAEGRKRYVEPRGLKENSASRRASLFMANNSGVVGNIWRQWRRLSPWQPTLTAVCCRAATSRVEMVEEETTEIVSLRQHHPPQHRFVFFSFSVPVFVRAI